MAEGKGRAIPSSQQLLLDLRQCAWESILLPCWAQAMKGWQEVFAAAECLRRGARMLRRGEDMYLQSERRRRPNIARPISLTPCETLTVGLEAAGWEKPRVNSASCPEGLEL